MVGEWGIVEPVEDVLIAEFGEGTAVFDRTSRTTHVLGPLGVWLLSLPGPTPFDELVGDLRDELGHGTAEAEAILARAISELASRGLLVDPSATGGDDGEPSPDDHRTPIGDEPSSKPNGVPASRGEVDGGGIVGRIHDVMGASIAFRAVGDDRVEAESLLVAIDDHLGGGADGGRPDRVLEVEPLTDGRIRLDVDGEWVFPARSAMLGQLDQILDDAGGRIDPLLVLHAGCVRLADGSLVLVSGGSGSRRSEVLEGLIRAGARYVARDVIGIDPRDGSIRVIRRPFRTAVTDAPDRMSDDERGEPGDASGAPVTDPAFDQVPPDGPITELWVLEHDPNPTAAKRTRLDPIGGLSHLTALTAQLGWLDDGRFEQLCRLASTITVVEAVHNDPADLVGRITDGSVEALPVGAPDRNLAAPSDLRPAPTSGTVVERVRVDDLDLAFASTPTHRLMLLDPLSAAVHDAADGGRSVDEIADVVREVLDPDDHPDPWPLVVASLVELADHGLLEPLPASWPVTNGRGLVHRPPGPWDDLDAWMLHDPPGRRGGFLTDELPGGSANGVLVQLDPSRRIWVETDEARTWLATRSAVVESAGECRSLISLAPIRVRRHHDAVDLLLEPTAEHPEPSEADDDVAPGESGFEQERIVGAALASDGTLLIPRTEAIPARVEVDPPPTEIDERFQPMSVRSVIVPSEETDLGRWLRLLDQLLDAETPGALSGLVHLSRGRIRPADEPADGSPDLGETDPAGDGDGSSDEPGGGASALLRWAEDVGATAFWDESVKIDRDKITPVRPLFRIDCRSLAAPSDRAVDGPEDDRPLEEVLAERFTELGLDEAHLAEAVSIAATVGEFHIGEERGPGGAWRRKLYVWTVSHDVRPLLSAAWVPLVDGARTDPSWVAWKFASPDPAHVELAVDLPYLDGVERVDDAVAPMLDRLPPDWSDAIDRLVGVAGIDRRRSPMRDDAITVELGGRFTVDLTVRGAPQDREGWRFVGSVRWLAAVAGHDRGTVDRLAGWVASGSMSNLIFGIDRTGGPFVNLYMRHDREVRGLGWRVPAS